MISHLMKKILENTTKCIVIIKNSFLNYIGPIILLIETRFNLIWKRKKNI